MPDHDIQKLKVMTVFGTRPEIIRLSRVFVALDAHVNHVMVHTGQSYDYEMSQVFFDELQIRKPDYFLGVQADTLGWQIANVIAKSEEVFKKELPDALLILGDTNSALSAIIAKRMRIPIFHMEAGNRAFDENVPEETNRRIVDHVSDIHLAYSEQSRRNLLREGLHPAKIFVTGSPMAEILRHHRDAIALSGVLGKCSLVKGGYIVVSIHREEHVDDREKLEKLFESLRAVSAVYDRPLIMTVHPRTAKRIEEYQLSVDDRIQLHKPFGFFDYVKLQQNAFCVLSDSGTLAEEAAILGFPAVHVRTCTERPEAFDTGSLMLSALAQEQVLCAVKIVTEQHAKGESAPVPADYRDCTVSSKVLRHIVGLTSTVKHHRACGFY